MGQIGIDKSSKATSNDFNNRNDTSWRCLLLSAFVGAFVFLCTMEALYWPLIMKPGTVLEWWQIRSLAAFGDILGFPVLLIAITITSAGWVLWGISAVWSVGIFFVIKMICRRITALRARDT